MNEGETDGFMEKVGGRNRGGGGIWDSIGRLGGAEVG